jgi:peroxiredoxin
MIDAMEPTVGVGVLHLFCKATPLAETDAILAAEQALLGRGDEGEEANETKVANANAIQPQLVAAALLGHKADICLMALGLDLWRLRQFQTDVETAGLTVVDSYLSLTELSEYASGLPEERKRLRLYPDLPPEGKSAFCFYPMSKRRGAQDNWYLLPYADREKLMMGHGRTGRNFAGRVLQLITGSTGLDDFEWGVTLFAVHPDDLKDCVYTMRYDEASSRFAEFGSFYTGMVAPLPEVLDAVGIRD